MSGEVDFLEVINSWDLVLLAAFYVCLKFSPTNFSYMSGQKIHQENSLERSYWIIKQNVPMYEEWIKFFLICDKELILVFVSKIQTLNRKWNACMLWWTLEKWLHMHEHIPQFLELIFQCISTRFMFKVVGIYSKHKITILLD